MARTVLFFSDLAILGGGEVCLAALLRTLDRERFRPVVIVPERGPLGDAVEEMGVRFYPVKLFEGMRAWRIKRYVYLHLRLRLARNLARLERVFSQEKVGLVHTHGGMYPENIRHLGRIARSAGVPVLWTCGYGGIYAPRVLREFIVPWVDRVIAVSGAVRDRLLSAGLLEPERVEVIHHGLDLASWKDPGSSEEIRRELGAGPGDILVGMVGRVVRIKGHDTLLQAAAQLLPSAPSVRFVVVGDQRPDEGAGGEYYRSLRQEARRLGLGERIVFAGWREDVAAVMGALDVLVQPSRQEAFGRTLLEAMAMGKPVVATRVGGMPEVVADGETGFLVPVDDARALAAAIALLVGDPAQRGAMGRAARQRVGRHFDLGEQTRRVERVYEGLLPGAGGGGDFREKRLAGAASVAGQ